MKIIDLTKTESIDETVKVLQVEKEGKPSLETLKKEWNVKDHRVITDKEFLKDKPLKNARGEQTGTKFVNRIAGPFQKMIVNRAVSFGFANPVEMDTKAYDAGTPEDKIIKAIEKILYSNKTKILDRQIARELYRATEVAEIWYYVKSETHEDYGFPCNYKIKVKVLKPWENDVLYPKFNEFDDMVAFSRGFTVVRDGKKVEMLDVYTDEEMKRYSKGETGWIEEKIDVEKNVINKIPVIYATQDQAEWSDVQYDIERLELLFSKHAEINDYHASPKTFIKGTLTSTPEAGEANGILQGGIDSDMKVISWGQSPDSIKLEIETRLENIHKFTQTPDISFKSIKSMNQISGVMLKMLFMDAHLKVMEKSEIWEGYFQRRYSVLKSIIGKLLQPSWEKVIGEIEIEPVIRPYMILDEKEHIENLMTANGNKPLISQKTAIKQSGLTVDADQEYLEIQNEEKASNLYDITEITQP